MDPRVITASLAAAVAAWGLARAGGRQPKPLAVRVQPYTAGGRSRLGTTVPETAVSSSTPGRSAIALVFGPFVRQLADGLARLVDASASTSAELRLRQAGLDMTVEQYRTRQLAYTVGALAGASGTVDCPALRPHAIRAVHRVPTTRHLLAHRRHTCRRS